MTRNYYQILEVKPDATADEIKKSYHHLAKQYHPDSSSASKETIDKFKEVKLAYEILSDPVKRAGYNEQFEELEEKSEDHYKPTDIFHRREKDSHAQKKDLLAAYWRIIVYILVFALFGLCVEWIIWWLAFSDERSFSFTRSMFGLLAGILMGFFWGVDANFKVDSFLGQGLTNRVYCFLRTTLMALSFGYLLGLFGNIADYYFYNHLSWLTILMTTLGMIIGSTVGSDGDTIEKIYSKEGRFNMFCTALRGVEIGLITAVVAVVFSLIMVKFGANASFIFWGGYFGFIIGAIAGSISPANLAAYASYTSAYLKNVMIVLLVIGALLLGIIIGTRYNLFFSNLVSTFWQAFLEVVR